MTKTKARNKAHTRGFHSNHSNLSFHPLILVILNQIKECAELATLIELRFNAIIFRHVVLDPNLRLKIWYVPRLSQFSLGL